MNGASRSGSGVLPVEETNNPSVPPSGFEAFWRSTCQQLLRIAPTASPVGEESTDKAVLAEMRSWDDAPVRMWMSSARRDGDDAPRPLLVTAHGYAGQMDAERVRRLSGFGLDVVGLDVRGFGRSVDAVGRLSPYGYLITGCQSHESSILRGAVCDYIQAYRAALEWFGAPSQVTFQGFSFAGGLSAMAAAVLAMAKQQEDAPPLPRILALGAPTFGYLQQRLQLCQSGSGRELQRYLQEQSKDADAIKRVFEYFDTCHFAPYLSTEGPGLERIIFGVGTYDPVVPAETVYAIKNALPEPPEMFVMPCSHTDRPEERKWVRWEGTWIRAAKGDG